MVYQKKTVSVNEKLTEHFTVEEMACRCGCGDYEMEPEFMESLELLRVDFGKPMPINSAKRCLNWNAKVGGAPDSQHPKGNAVDVRVMSDRDRARLIMLAFRRGFTGIGIHKDFVHLDRKKGEPRMWLY